MSGVQGADAGEPHRHHLLSQLRHQARLGGRDEAARQSGRASVLPLVGAHRPPDRLARPRPGHRSLPASGVQRRAPTQSPRVTHTRGGFLFVFLFT